MIDGTSTSPSFPACSSARPMASRVPVRPTPALGRRGGGRGGGGGGGGEGEEEQEEEEGEEEEGEEEEEEGATSCNAHMPRIWLLSNTKIICLSTILGSKNLPCTCKCLLFVYPQ